MAYQSLYRTYRPQSFEEVAGQRFIVKTLVNALKNDKIAHAYLFTGPRGTGKTSIARLLAKAINCTGEHKPCQECPSCRACNDGNHPDVIEIDAASNNGVEEIRELIDKVKYSPLLGSKKIYIVDEVHMLSPGAFNAFLKTLEEPPSHVIFILATTEPHKVLATILSRCQRFDFGKVGRDDIKKRIGEVLQQEKLSYDDEVLSLIAELAEGGMRDALTITDQAIAYTGGEVTATAVREIYGVIPKETRIDFIRALATADLPKALQYIVEFDEKGADLPRLVNDLVVILKDVAVSCLTRNEGLPLSLNSQEISLLREELSLDQTMTMIETLTTPVPLADPRRVLELAAFKIIAELSSPAIRPEPRPRPVGRVEAPRPSQIKERSAEVVKPKEPETVKAREPETIKEDQDYSLDKLLNVLVQADKAKKEKVATYWPKIAKALSRTETADAAVLLVDAKLFAAAPGALILTYKNRPQVTIARQGPSLALMSQFLEGICGERFAVYPISQEEEDSLRKEFIDRKNQGTLPSPQPIAPPTGAVATHQEKELTDFFSGLVKEE